MYLCTCRYSYSKQLQRSLRDDNLKYRSPRKGESIDFQTKLILDPRFRGNDKKSWLIVKLIREPPLQNTLWRLKSVITLKRSFHHHTSPQLFG